MKDERPSMANEIAEYNKLGICTKDAGTYGCACPTCRELFHISAEKLLGKLKEEENI